MKRRKLKLTATALIAVLLALLLVAAMLNIGTKPETPPETTPPTTTETTAAPTTTEPPPSKPRVTWATVPEGRVLTASQYFVYDSYVGDFTNISCDPEERIYPASITKLFTAYVALQYLDPEETLRAGDEVRLRDPESSIAMIWWGDRLTVAQLIEGMLLPSGNDAAYILAAAAGRRIAQDSSLEPQAAVDAFVARMNEAAQEEGLTGTNFANPDGIHKDDHYTTARDLVVIANLSLENELIAKYAALAKDATPFTGDESRKTWKNTNLILHSDSDYYCPLAVGLKTGKTNAAGNCLLSAFRYEDVVVIVGVFGCPEHEDRFADTLQLFNEYLNQ